MNPIPKSYDLSDRLEDIDELLKIIMIFWSLKSHVMWTWYFRDWIWFRMAWSAWMNFEQNPWYPDYFFSYLKFVIWIRKFEKKKKRPCTSLILTRDSDTIDAALRECCPYRLLSTSDMLKFVHIPFVHVIRNITKFGAPTPMCKTLDYYHGIMDGVHYLHDISANGPFSQIHEISFHFR